MSALYSDYRGDVELDALVTARVIGGAGLAGFACPRCGSSYFGSSEQAGRFVRHCQNPVYRCGWSGAPEEAPPPFSTDVASAWKIVHQLSDMDFELSRLDEADGVWWNARFDEFTAEERTAPLAICRAALKAVGHE